VQYKSKSFSLVGKSAVTTTIKKLMFLLVVAFISFFYSYFVFKLAIYFDVEIDTPVRELDGYTWVFIIGLQIFFIIPLLCFIGLRFLQYVFNKFDL
jgi:hypothetical protein